MQWFYAYIVYTACINEHINIYLWFFNSFCLILRQLAEVHFPKQRKNTAVKSSVNTVTDQKAEVDVTCYKQTKIMTKTWQLFRSGGA